MRKIFELVGEFAVYAIILIGAIVLLSNALADITSY